MREACGERRPTAGEDGPDVLGLGRRHAPTGVLHLGTAARSVVDATPELLDLAGEILQPVERQPLVVADAEHFAGELLRTCKGGRASICWSRCPANRLSAAVSGDSARTVHASLGRLRDGQAPGRVQVRSRRDLLAVRGTHGERPEDWHFKGFGCTRDRDEVAALTEDTRNVGTWRSSSTPTKPWAGNAPAR